MWDPLHQSDPAHQFVKNLFRDLFSASGPEHEQAEFGD
jgi:hypothetical protein